ncbi:MAG: InlB B-repeat-containing protein, partial [Bacteroidales bacterium]|nr:InlB B-repeat-containing protein [Bacteroidales bacterium]
MKNLHLLMLSALVFATTAGQAQNNTVDLSEVTSNTLTVTDGQILTGTLGGHCNITIADGASITLSNATISLASNFSFQYAGLTCLGNATIILEGENSVKGFYNSYPGIYVPKDATLTIKGSGKLDAKGEMNGCGIGGQFSTKAEHASGNIVIESGTINATGGFQAAGIGGAGNLTSGNITIKGGTVTAQGGEYAPGIGSGKSNTAGNITITKDVVKVTSIRGEYAPYCIGAADKGKCGTITLGDFTTDESIEGESVTFTPSLKSYNVALEANGGSGEMASVTLLPGLPTHIPQNAFTRSGYKFIGWNTEKDGSGTSFANAEFVTDISTPGSTLTLYAQWYQGDMVDLSTLTGNYEAKNNDILTGTLKGNYKITIKDGATVTLHGVTIEGENDENYAWAGITCLGDATINLVAKNIVKGFDSEYPGIYVPENKTLTIKGTGALDASSNGIAAGIGAGSNKIPCGNIVIESGTIKATGGNGAAGIGGGRYSSCGDITIKGGKITAMGKTMEDVSGSKAAGIGKGQDATCSKVILGYTKASDYILANGYIADKITIAEDKTFIVEGVSTTTYTSESTINWETLNGAKLVPAPSAY